MKVNDQIYLIEGHISGNDFIKIMVKLSKSTVLRIRPLLTQKIVSEEKKDVTYQILRWSNLSKTSGIQSICHRKSI